jgi:FixJ family two-component response regulator
MGYKGITYDRIGSASSNNSKGDQNLLYWLDKIDEVKKMIEPVEQTINDFTHLLDTLEARERELILRLFVAKISKRIIIGQLSISLDGYDRMINKIIRKWELYINKPSISGKH